MDFAAAEVEVDVVVGDGAGEDLRDSPQLEDERGASAIAGDSRGWAEPTPVNR